MLVLSRKKDERIVLTNSVDNKPLATITVVRIDQNKVRVGIDADTEITVLREELIDKLIEK